jgi:hypothetical protein
VLFCACVVVALMRKAPMMALLSLVGAFMFGVLALEQKDLAALEGAGKFLKSIFGG